MSCGYIDDGFTLDGFIKEESELYAALHFQYRPLTADEQIRNLTELPKLAADLRSERIADVISKKIVSWDLKDSKGNPVKIATSNCKRLRFELQDRLLAILCDSRLSDKEDDAEEEQPSTFAETGPGNLPAG